MRVRRPLGGSGRCARTGILARGKLALGCAVVGLVGVVTGPALAAPGDLDTSFGGGTGKSLVNLGGTELGNGVALAPDGGIVVVGEQAAPPGDRHILVVRLLATEGTLDPSF